MDAELISWARGVKRRTKARLPPLWLFTDARAMPDLAATIAHLPAGLCGVVFRHDGAPDRAALARRIARLCRARRIALVIAGDARLADALGAGLHLRATTSLVPARPPRRALITAAAHNHAQVRRAHRVGAALVFISPVFPTASHPGSPALGPAAWRGLARAARPRAAGALGGVTGKTVKRLGPGCTVAAGIGAFVN